VESETFGTYQFFNLTDRNFKQVWVPKGFGHGFLTMEDETEVCYKVDEYYEPSADITIRYDDVDLGIDWPATCLRVSEKDSLGISLAQFKQQTKRV
jgi:dTDP-4-dehydrorhamnose 3,5-epimerase